MHESTEGGRSRRSADQTPPSLRERKNGRNFEPDPERLQVSYKKTYRFWGDVLYCAKTITVRWGLIEINELLNTMSVLRIIKEVYGSATAYQNIQ